VAGLGGGVAGAVGSFGNLAQSGEGEQGRRQSAKGKRSEWLRFAPAGLVAFGCTGLQAVARSVRFSLVGGRIHHGGHGGGRGLPFWRVGSFCIFEGDGARWQGLAWFGARWHIGHAYPRRLGRPRWDVVGGEGRHGTRKRGRLRRGEWSCAHGASTSWRLVRAGDENSGGLAVFFRISRLFGRERGLRIARHGRAPE
jgi:hypothetical protein